MPCDANLYANEEPDAEGRTHYMCLPCGILGSESQYCSVSWGTMMLLLGIVIILALVGVVVATVARQKKAQDLAKKKSARVQALLCDNPDEEPGDDYSDDDSKVDGFVKLIFLTAANDGATTDDHRAFASSTTPRPNAATTTYETEANPISNLNR
eukprot:SAG31_NODE_5275_length_2637_cov_2.078802_2_plen_155_part_00